MRAKTIVPALVLLLLGAMGGALLAPPSADAVSREIIEIQQAVNQILQNQQDLRSDMDAKFASVQTLAQQALSASNHLTMSFGALQKTVQDAQANSGANNNSIAQQMQGVSDNMQDMQSRVQKIAQQLSDIQSTLQTINAKVSPTPASSTPSLTSAPNLGNNPNSASSGDNQGTSSLHPVSGDTLYSNALRDLNSGHYDLSRQEFGDYLRHFPDGAFASNAQFYLGEISYAQGSYNDAIAAYDNVILNYPKSSKVPPAILEKARALTQLGKRSSAAREFRELIRRFPGTQEARKASAELKRLSR